MILSLSIEVANIGLQPMTVIALPLVCFESPVCIKIGNTTIHTSLFTYTDNIVCFLQKTLSRSLRFDKSLIELPRNTN